MPTWNHYLLPHSIPDALLALNNAIVPTRIIAGGTDLLLDLQQGRHTPIDTLIDVCSIPELNCLEFRQDRLFIGAAVPLSVISASKLVQFHANAVAEACYLVGGPQVRNTATLGGNVAHALPAADGTIALVAVDAQAEIANLEGVKRIPILDLFRGPGQSTLDSSKDILVGFYIPKIEIGQGSAFARVMRPQGVALPILNMATWIRREDDKIAEMRLSVGPSGPTPRRAFEVENYLSGNEYTGENVKYAVEVLLEHTIFRSSLRRASAVYRQHLCPSLFNEVLAKAWERAEPVNINGFKQEKR